MTIAATERSVSVLPDLGLWEALARLPIGVLAVDASGSIIAANPAAHTLLGWPAGGLGPLPESLRALICNLERTSCPASFGLGVCFPCWADAWREAWITRSGVLQDEVCWVVLRSVDDERQQSLESCARLGRLSLMGEITTALNSTIGLEETFNVILVGVTARQGLGFNRAFLFLSDEKEEYLTGCTAIGPASPGRAEVIWNALASQGAGGLTEAVCTYRLALDGDDAEVNRRVCATRIPQRGLDNPFAEVLRGAPARAVRLENSAHPEVRAVFASLDACELACAPLRSRDRVVGLLLADHRITGRPITPESLRALELLAGQAGLAVERARLADKLSRRLEQLRQAYDRINDIQELVARLERFSVIGEITAEVAHQLRNPMTIIGGFARSLLTTKAPEDPDYRALTVIGKQADRVCAIVDRIISVEGWEGPPRQTFALEPVLRQSLEILETRFSNRRVSWSLVSELGGFALSGRPDALRFALFKVLSGLLEHLAAGTAVTVSARCARGTARVVFCPKMAENESEGVKAAIAKIFQGEWGTGPAQRSLALEYLGEHHGALGIETVEDGRPALVVELTSTEDGV